MTWPQWVLVVLLTGSCASWTLLALAFRRAERNVPWCACGWITIPAGWDQVHDVGAHMQHTSSCCQPCWEVLT